MLSIEQITQEVLSLPSNLRIQLLEELIESLESDIDETVHSAWIVEVKRRRDEIHSGIVEPIPGEEALAQIRQMLGQ